METMIIIVSMFLTWKRNLLNRFYDLEPITSSATDLSAGAALCARPCAATARPERAPFIRLSPLLLQGFLLGLHVLQEEVLVLDLPRSTACT